MKCFKLIYDDTCFDVYSVVIQTQEKDSAPRAFCYGHAYSMGHGKIINIKPVDTNTNISSRLNIYGLFKFQANQLIWLTDD